MRVRALAVVAAAAAAAVLPGLVGPPVLALPPAAASDTVKPTITITAPPPVVGSWYDRPVTITATADDNDQVASLSWQLGGAQTGSGSQPDGDPVAIPVSAEGVTALDLTATDWAGNVATRRWWVSVDLAAPTISTNLADGAEIPWGSVRTWQFACADELAGLASCAGSLADGQPVPTDTLGPRTLAVAAEDKVGHRRDVTVHYTVVPARFVLVGEPSVSGSPVVGSRLVATAPTFDPTPTSTDLRWLRDGHQVATGASYDVTAADAGAVLAVEYVARRPGYDDATGAVWSDRVARLASRTTARVARTSTAARISVRVAADGRVPTGQVTVLRKGRAVATLRLSDGAARFRVPRTQVRRSLVVRYPGDTAVEPSQVTVRIPAR